MQLTLPGLPPRQEAPSTERGMLWCHRAPGNPQAPLLAGTPAPGTRSLHFRVGWGQPPPARRLAQPCLSASWRTLTSPVLGPGAVGMRLQASLPPLPAPGTSGPPWWTPGAPDHAPPPPGAEREVTAPGDPARPEVDGFAFPSERPKDPDVSKWIRASALASPGQRGSCVLGSEGP